MACDLLLCGALEVPKPLAQWSPAHWGPGPPKWQARSENVHPSPRVRSGWREGFLPRAPHPSCFQPVLHPVSSPPTEKTASFWKELPQLLE